MYRYATKLDYLMLVFGVLGSIIHGLIMPSFAIIFGSLIDTFSQTDPEKLFDSMASLCIDFVYAGIAGFVGGYLHTALFIHTSERQIREIRRRYLTQILRQDVAWYDAIGTGELTTRVSQDMILIQQAIGDKLGIFIQFFCTFLAGLGVGLYKGWQLALVIIAVTPLLAIGGGIMMRLTTVFTLKGNEAYASAGNVAQETLSNMRTIASLSGEKPRGEKYITELKTAWVAGVKKGFVSGLGFGITMGLFFFDICIGIICWRIMARRSDKRLYHWKSFDGFF